jgi:hypothetical protein
MIDERSGSLLIATVGKVMNTLKIALVAVGLTFGLTAFPTGFTTDAVAQVKKGKKTKAPPQSEYSAPRVNAAPHTRSGGPGVDCWRRAATGRC